MSRPTPHDAPLFDADYHAEDGAQLDLLTGEVAAHDGPPRLYTFPTATERNPTP